MVVTLPAKIWAMFEGEACGLVSSIVGWFDDPVKPLLPAQKNT
jgi:hypothetical protein